MEEIVGADAIRVEILEDARKKAARLLVECAEESARTVAAIEAKAVSVVEEIMRASEARSRRFRMETMARFPLERTRMRTVFVDKRLSESLRSYLDGLGEASVARLAEGMLARGAAFLAAKDVILGRRGLSEGAARAIAGRILASAASVEVVQDETLPARGLVARDGEGSLVLRATMDLVEERLLDRHRSELSQALCAEARRL